MREVRQRVTEWAHENGARAEAQRTLTLLTSEIVSNAVQHGPPGGPITVVARRDRTGFRVEVTDTGAGEPVVRPFEVTRARGRGMQLVEMLSTEWGISRDNGGGTSVWFFVSG